MTPHDPHTYSPLDIARYFLAMSESTPAKGLTPMQIIKLVYIAHGWSLGIFDRALIDNSEKTKAIQAWTHGPVVEILYHVFKWKRSSVVPWDYLTRPFSDEVPTPAVDERVEDAEDLLNFVWRKYGHRGGWYLSGLTHQLGTPWHRVIEMNKRGDENKNSLHIPDNIIRSYYLDLVNKLIQNKNG